MLRPHKAMKAPSSDGGPGLQTEAGSGFPGSAGGCRGRWEADPQLLTSSGAVASAGPAGLRLQAASSHGLQV